MSAAAGPRQRSGLVERTRNPTDGRGALISLTTAGRDLIDKAFPEVLAIEQRMFAGLSPTQRTRAVTALRQILASAEASQGQFSPSHDQA
jgi:DNA-binding MarR family transcriptional regulator